MVAADEYFTLTPDELREVARFAVAAAEQVLPLVERDLPDDPRPRAAVDAARVFADGADRSRLQRTTATAAHRAAKEATSAAGHDAAMAAGDAAASAYLHPYARADQVAHILRSTAHAACAVDVAGGGARAAEEVLADAVSRATPTLLDVLRRYPPAPTGRTPVARVMADLDARLRAR